MSWFRQNKHRLAVTELDKPEHDADEGLNYNYKWQLYCAGKVVESGQATTAKNAGVKAKEAYKRHCIEKERKRKYGSTNIVEVKDLP